MYDLTQAEEHLRPPEPIDKEEVADFLISLFEGSLLMARSTKNRRIIQDNLLSVENQLESLFYAKH